MAAAARIIELQQKLESAEARAEKAERDRDEMYLVAEGRDSGMGIHRPSGGLTYVARAQKAEAERDALRDEVVRLREALGEAWRLANAYKEALDATHRGEVMGVVNDAGPRRRIMKALSTPTTAQAAEKERS